MPAKVMKVTSVEKHPNADSLRVYILEAQDDKRQVIANLENVYEPGDLVNVVLEGSILKDGTHIKPVVLRGLPSRGMALGPALDGTQVGDDITEQFCQPLNSTDISVVKWPEIESLHHVRRGLELSGMSPRIRYRSKIKLDGANGGVQILPDGRVVAQTRTVVVSPGEDNYGFATWVNSNTDHFKSLKKSVRQVVFGEWAGKGIQKRTSISQIDRKIFVVFAILVGDEDCVQHMECEPESIKLLLGEHPDIFVLPWYGDELLLDFKDQEQLQKQADIINTMVSDVEACDPWVKDMFGIEGLGEGVVMYPLPGGGVTFGRSMYSDFMFKAKGEKHKVVNTKKPVQLNPELVETIDGFVKLFVTESRLEQGLSVVCGGVYDQKYIGEFVKWFSQDVKKESVLELEKSGLDWKDIAKQVNSAASDWYKKRLKDLSC